MTFQHHTRSFIMFPPEEEEEAYLASMTPNWECTVALEDDTSASRHALAHYSDRFEPGLPGWLVRTEVYT